MQMRPGHQPRSSHPPNYLTRFHEISFLDIDPAHMEEHAGHPMAMIDADGIAMDPEAL